MSAAFLSQLVATNEINTLAVTYFLKKIGVV